MANQTSKTVRQQTTPLFIGRLKDAGSRLNIFVVRRVQPVTVDCDSTPARSHLSNHALKISFQIGVEGWSNVLHSRY